jgi:outer membrane biosynthesis protein TonB
MARGQNEFGSLRFSRREREWLIAALLFSLLLHLGVWGGYVEGNKLGWWQKLHLPAWLQPAAKKFALQALFAHDSQPDIFVDVSHADMDAPDRARYYSNKNSRAANPEPAVANAPKIAGTQTDVPKTEDVPKPAKPAEDTPKVESKPQVTQLQPTMPPPQPQLAKAETPEPPETPGETDLPKPKPPPVVTNSPAPPTPPQRPRTLKEALAQRDQLPGPAMQQSGGVARHAMWSSLDAKATPFGDYDRAIIEAVSQRWYDLLDSRRFAQDRSGKVMLRFKLKPDGTIIEMQTTDNNVGELLGYLCQEAIEEAAPFAKWPPDMVRMIGANYREISFTFYYY